MVSSNLIKQLQERDLIAQITDEEALINRLTQGQIVLYCGFDPTADSLHVGHLAPLLCLKRFQLAGHKPIVLLGGGTGMIGDPSFKATERKLNTNEVVSEWGQKIYRQIYQFLDFNSGSNSTIAVNNYNWLSNMSVLTFLRDIGKYFSINQMIKKEAVKQRLNRHNSGITFTEFAYSLLQGFDFSQLYLRHQAELQIGGSDQWGNITAGIDLVRRRHKQSVFGLTVPLITKTDGTKFGKTESGTIWLSANKTSPYKFYQFWLNTADADVYRFLKYFTFLNLEAIQTLEEEGRSSSQSPRAQHVLAEKVTNMVHGTEGLAAAKRITQSLFSGMLYNMSKEDLAQLAIDGIPTIKFPGNMDLQQALVNARLVSSRSQARTMIASNAVSINGEKQLNPKYILKDMDRLFGRYTLLRRGKKHYCMIDWE